MLLQDTTISGIRFSQGVDPKAGWHCTNCGDYHAITLHGPLVECSGCQEFVIDEWEAGRDS